jgi:hypothetical protein
LYPNLFEKTTYSKVKNQNEFEQFGQKDIAIPIINRFSGFLVDQSACFQLQET